MLLEIGYHADNLIHEATSVRLVYCLPKSLILLLLILLDSITDSDGIESRCASKWVTRKCYNCNQRKTAFIAAG